MFHKYKCLKNDTSFRNNNNIMKIMLEMYDMDCRKIPDMHFDGFFPLNKSMSLQE